MEESKKHIDELFKKGLGDYTELPPADIWQALDKRLDSTERKKPSYRWLWYTIAALLLGSLLFWALKNMSAEKESIPGKEKIENTTSSDITKPGEERGNNYSKKSYEEQIDVTAIGSKTIGNSKATDIERQGSSTGLPQPNSLAGAKALKQTIKKTTGNTGSNIEASGKTTANKTAAGWKRKDAANKNISGIQQERNENGTNAPKKLPPRAITENKNSDVNHNGAKKNSISPSAGRGASNKNDNNTKAFRNQVDNNNSTAGNKTMPEIRSTTNSRKNPRIANDNAEKAIVTRAISNRAGSNKTKTPDETLAYEEPLTTYKGAGEKAKETIQPQPKAAFKADEFVPDNSRESGGIKVSDHLKEEDEGGEDEIKEPEVVQNNKGKGGGGSSSGEEEDKKNKRRKKNKKGLEAGVKLGYETGFNGLKANKAVISPYLQYNFASNVALIFQPAIKYASLNKTDIGDPESYFSKGPASVTTNHTNIPSVDTTQPDAIIRRYYYTAAHDSIVIKKVLAKKTYWEMEFPLLLQYKLSKDFNLYVGGALNFSKVVEIRDEQQQYNILQRDSILFSAVPVTNPAPVVPTADGFFTNSGTPFSQYNGSSNQNAVTNPLRFSFMIGFNYNINERLFFDVMLQQTASDTKYIPNASVRDIYKQTYVRVGLGFRFTK